MLCQTATMINDAKRMASGKVSSGCPGFGCWLGGQESAKEADEITKEEYDRWRYYYPKYDTSGQWHKITPSQELSDLHPHGDTKLWCGRNL